MRRTDVMAKKLSPLPFEVALTELEPLAGQSEQGEPIPDEGLRRIAQGMVPARSGQTALCRAEQKVEQLLKQHGELAVLPFSTTVG